MPAAHKTSSVESSSLTIQLRGEALTFENGQGTLLLSQKWAVFYALLLLREGELLTIDEVCDHHPWSRQLPAVAGREIWRFVREQEPRLFGLTVTGSPVRQSTKAFYQQGDVKVSWEPSREAVCEALAAASRHYLSEPVELSEATLLMQSGMVVEAEKRLRELLPTLQNVNSQAHAQSLLTSCLERQHGPWAVERQMNVLRELLDHSLTTTNRARVLIRMARFYTLTEQYPQAGLLYEQLTNLLTPAHGLEYAHFLINHGLYLRRTGDLKGALRQTRFAHDQAQAMQWWYGVQATQSNLALMHVTAAEQLSGAARTLEFQHALKWAMKCSNTTDATSQGADEADVAILLGQIHRELKEYDLSRRWLDTAIRIARQVPNYQDLRDAYAELLQLEKTLGNTFSIQVTEDWLAEAEQQLQSSSTVAD